MDESQKTDIQEASEEPIPSPSRSARKEALFLPTFAGCLVGMLIGTLPAALWVLVFHFPFAPMFTFLPMFIYLGLKIFGGYTDRRGVIAMCVFSAVGFYLTLLSIVSAAYVAEYHMFFLNFPLITITLIGQGDVLTGHAFSSAYIFPVIFTLFGILLSSELLKRRATLRAAHEI